MSTTDGGPPLMRWRHEEQVLAALRDRGALRRAELGALVGLSRTTLSEIVGDLLRRGAITVVSTDAEHRRGSGRPAELIALDPRSGQYLGLDFTHAAIHLEVVDAGYAVIATLRSDLGADAPWPERIEAALGLVDELEAGGTHLGALQGVGVGLPGPDSPAWSGDHTAAREASSRARLAVEHAVQERLGLLPLLDTNTRLAALAEAVPAGRAADGDGAEEQVHEDLVYLRLAAGVGGGVVVGGRLVHGARGLAGELGHVGVREGGHLCRCGRPGCLETVASLPAVIETCRERGLDLPGDTDRERAAALGEAAAHEDPILEEVLREAGTAAGHVLAATVLALNPAEVVVGGTLPQLAPAILRHIASTLTDEVRTIDGARPRVRASQRGDSGGATGAIIALVHRTSLLAGYPGGRPVLASPRLRRSPA
ncbi:ROK family protein [Brachybacterium sp. NBEC-018]|uniref:ROK family transcriptional regulator n=1 Tax=Brachybacterium sp. NBEC-018 TaxID=2996004 RepID=UPI0021754231|nr:ROK family transcriptional regulator [Brachybacterium sp. NBEC-018]UVY84061.1 ROK family protein [Brachybacterium sp. NBEC-018]